MGVPSGYRPNNADDIDICHVPPPLARGSFTCSLSCGKIEYSQFSSSDTLRVLFQGPVEHVLLVDNLLLGHFTMGTIVIAILLTPRISVAFLNKLADVCIGRQDLQLVSRKKEGEMMVQG